eukprot:GHRQ01019740.1.p2 GENE.GHRQ01019740.1~~GHRQ01019740.1.p2  ORF type:complete len:181 (+),score=42.19 GHRQ01019740.1:849-1391(+)
MECSACARLGCNVYVALVAINTCREPGNGLAQQQQRCAFPSSFLCPATFFSKSAEVCVVRVFCALLQHALHCMLCCLLCVACSPAHAMYFATYEQAKQLLGGNRQGYQWLPTATAGAIATVVNDGLMTPVDVVKQRLQVAHSPYRGLADCLRQILLHEGVGALYKSYRSALWRRRQQQQQ